MLEKELSHVVKMQVFVKARAMLSIYKISIYVLIFCQLPSIFLLTLNEAGEVMISHR